MSEGEEALDEALAAWLQAREDDPDLLPGDFAAGLEPVMRSAFLRELEELAVLDREATLAPPRDLPLRFGDFRILRQLGQGGMGTVYEAEQVSTQTRVALKILHPHFAGDARTAARFEREAHTAASLVHPHIVRIRGFGHHEDSAWIAMDVVRGRSLQRLLAAALEPRDADHARARSLFDDHRALCSALADAADALDFAHRHGVVHRDVKPANLILDEGGRIMVLDFGLASTRWDSADLTRTGDFLGTPLYMSPEQASGDSRVGPGSDVYSLGAVLYEALTGSPPVAPGPLPAILDGIRHGEPTDPRKLVPDVPPDLALVARKCLEKEPRWRYGSAAEMADDLRRYVDGSAVQARPAGALVRTGRRIRRRPVIAAVTALCVVLAAGATWYGLNRGASAARLHLDSELRTIAAELALSPQGITAFGGATRRWFESFGMGDHLPKAEMAVAETASSALARAEELVRQYPSDLRALRLLARVRMDLGNDPVATGKAIADLLTVQGAEPEPRDRALKAVQLLLEEKLSDAEVEFARPVEGGAVQFFHGLYWQVQQDYAQAIAAFDRALLAKDLDEELRYFALLHRGWCRTCPEVGELRAAQDDLLQAAALRPNYGTARLLWAGLRCLDPDAASLQAAVAAVTEVLNAVKGEPWVVVLTARVLLQFAEDSTRQAGPVRFCSELAPLVALPLEPARRTALAATALQLLDGVVEKRPDLWEPHVHRVAALALLDRHGEALQTVERLARMPGANAALTALLAARVHLAAGQTRLAHERIETALREDPRYAAAHLLAADLAHHIGDAKGEEAALAGAAAALPPQATVLPRIQERIARVQLAAGRPQDALATLAAKGFGSALSGSEAPRARAERAVLRVLAEEARRATKPELLAALDFAEREIAAVAPRPEQPLRALLSLLAPVYERIAEPVSAARLQKAVLDGQSWDWWTLLALQQHGRLELPAEQRVRRLREDTRGRSLVPVSEALAQVQRTRDEGRGEAVTILQELEKQDVLDTAAIAALAAELHRSGDEAGCLSALSRLMPGPASQALAPLLQEAPNLPARALDLLQVLARSRGAAEDNSAARLLAAAVLYVRGEPGAAAEFLSSTQSKHPDDLRGRYLLACSLVQAGRAEEARAVLRGSDGAALLGKEALPLVQRATGMPVDARVAGAVASLL